MGWNKKHITILLLLISLLFSAPINTINAQNKKSKLKNEKNKLRKDIEYTNKLLKQTKKNRKASFNDLIILKNQIRKRRSLITTISNEINTIQEDITVNKADISRMTLELETLKNEYAKMIYYAYKNRSSYDRLSFIFSSEDFNQAYKRLKYLKEYSKYRQDQAHKIQSTSDTLKKRTIELELQRSEKEELLKNEEVENDVLKKNKQEKNSLVVSLRRKEKQLKKEIRKKEAAERKLKEEIERIIAEEMRKREAAKKDVNALTPEEKLVSKNFETNRTKLPWPSAKGVIVSTFGVHSHPELKDIKIKNNGIDIATIKGTKARAIFTGKVTGVISIPGSGNAIIIRHGEYLSVYSNLGAIYVKKGDLVKTKQEIGIIRTNSEESKTELHFEIWKAKTLLDPQLWITREKYHY